jgi:CRISPR system Cascade subunit CasA
MKTPRILALVTTAGALLGACAHYEPVPVAPERFAARYDAGRLDEPPGGGAWDNAALLKASLDHSSSLREAQATYRAARAAAKASRTPPPISLTLVAEYSRDAGGATPWLYSGLLNIPLDAGAKRDARLSTADLAAVQALYDYAEAIWTVRSALVHAHIERLAAEREAVLAQQAVQLRADRAHKLEQRIRSGEDARPAGVAAAADLATAQRRLQDLTNQRVQADAALAKALGVGIAAVQPITLEPLPNTVTPPAPADLIVWRQEAVLRRRDVLRVVADYAAAEQGVRLEVAKQYPDVQLGPGYTFERGQHKIPFDLTLVLPPRDLNRANIRSAEAKRALAAAKLDSVQAAVLAAVDQSSTALIGAKAGLDRALNQDLPLARRADAAARKALAAGDLDRLDQEAAQAAAVDAEIAALEAWKQAWIAVADLEDALRQPSAMESAALEAAVKRAGDPQ